MAERINGGKVLFLPGCRSHSRILTHPWRDMERTSSWAPELLPDRRSHSRILTQPGGIWKGPPAEILISCLSVDLTPGFWLYPGGMWTEPPVELQILRRPTHHLLTSPNKEKTQTLHPSVKQEQWIITSGKCLFEPRRRRRKKYWKDMLGNSKWNKLASQKKILAMIADINPHLHNTWYHQAHSLIGMPYLPIIASNITLGFGTHD